MNQIFTPRANKNILYAGCVPNTPEGWAFIKELRKTKNVRCRGCHKDRKSLVGQVTQVVTHGKTYTYKHTHKMLRTAVPLRLSDRIRLYVTDKKTKEFVYPTVDRDHILPKSKIFTKEQEKNNIRITFIF